MYQYCSSSLYPDPSFQLHPHFSAFPSPQAPSPPPATHHHHDPFSSYHLYPPSPPHGAASPPSAGGGAGFFLGPAAASPNSLPSSFLHSSGSSTDSDVLSLHKYHLLEPSHHLCNAGGGGMNGSSHLYDQHDYFDFPSAMQATNNLRPPPGAESYTPEVGGAGEAAAMAARVGRYTAEERKERIERYRSKRNHRNFQKKITYACRKTLADSRPRVRGRFARNGEADQPEAEAEAEAGEVSSCNNSSSQSGGGDYCFGWRPVADDEDEYYYGCDPDYFWANFVSTPCP